MDETSGKPLDESSASHTSNDIDVGDGTDERDASVSVGGVSSVDALGSLDAGYPPSIGTSSGQVTYESTDACASRSAIATSGTADAGESQPPSLCGNGAVDSGELCDPNEPESGEKCAANCTWRILSVVAGADHTCALAANGDVKCWGGNELGQLGLDVAEPMVNLVGRAGRDLPPLNINSSVTIALTAGLVHTCALSREGEVRCWGNHTNGKLGYPEIAPDAVGNRPGEVAGLVPVDLGGIPARAVAAGEEHTCAVLEGGNIKCWGNNTYFQLGVCTGTSTEPGVCSNPMSPTVMGNALQPVALGDVSGLDGGASGSESGERQREALKVTTGAYHTCANLNDGAIRCWGKDDDGQRGMERRERGYPLPGRDYDLWDAVLNSPGGATDVVVGGDHSCAILAENASVKCWGRNDMGQLGQPEGIPPEQMMELDSIFPPGVRIKRLAAGENHTCALLESDELKCWGSDEFGQLGVEDKSALGIEGNVGDDPGEMSKLPPIGLGEGNYAVDVAAGYNHTCAILNSGLLKCWGKNTHGQLGLNDLDNRGQCPHDMSTLPTVELF